ncbi:hypothetical protein HC891_20810, partial [Candidatus Gracilibacteria bacterium]|nr:hypothetical protein [Candidatus Gracilibacteria bacterium]
HIYLDGLHDKVTYAQLLHDASEVRLRYPGEGSAHDNTHAPTDSLMLELPVRKPDVVVPVVELFLNYSDEHNDGALFGVLWAASLPTTPQTYGSMLLPSAIGVRTQ